MKISPFAPAQFPEVAQVKGVQLYSAASGERYQDRLDCLFALLPEGSSSAAVFTQSLTPGAPVVWSKQALADGSARGLFVNAGRANVCTGKQGFDDAKAMAQQCAEQWGLEAKQIYVCSTGVIGERLVIDKLLAAVPKASQFPASSSHWQDAACDWQDAASAILTTDTFAKAASVTLDIGGETVCISGFAKGSGMIAPNMATMLAYVFTDAKIDTALLQSALATCVESSFNSITVDSDTSTSDTCIAFATGLAMTDSLQAGTAEMAVFESALSELCQNLAHQIIADGEGVSKFITVNVSGAETDAAAKIIALSIANSPLVKTAIAGEDANWGRIVMAVGKAGQAINFEQLTIAMGEQVIAEGDGPRADYVEADLNQHLKGERISIAVDCGLQAAGKATVWTCDLTHEYIEINADYRS